ncbi:MAG: hypothetical protein QM749_04425 [Aquabacterium sp.]
MSLPFVAPTEDTHAFNYHALDAFDFSDSAKQASRETEWSATLGITSRTKRAQGPRLMPSQTVANWREATQATIAQTAERFGVSAATVKRYCAASANA